MLKIACREISALDCLYEAVDETDDGIRQKLIDHLLAEHGDKMDSMDDKGKDSMSEKIEELIANAETA